MHITRAHNAPEKRVRFFGTLLCFFVGSLNNHKFVVNCLAEKKASNGQNQPKHMLTRSSFFFCHSIIFRFSVLCYVVQINDECVCVSECVYCLSD